MNVDNGFCVWKYNGAGPILKSEQERAYTCAWRPAAVGVYENRNPSPNSRRVSSDDGAVGSAGAATPAAAPKYQAYRPPGSTGALANLLRREAGPVGKVKVPTSTVSPSVPSSGSKTRAIPSLPVGATNPSSASSASSDGPSANAIRYAKRKENAKKKKDDETAASAAANDATAKAAASVVSTREDPEKRAKGLRKRIKQIEELRAKQAQGIQLNDDQLSKLASHADLSVELAALSLS
jgi:hypothetical protein